MKWRISLLLLICGSVAQSQNALPENYFLKTLDNGLQVLVIENNYLPMASVSTCIRNGAAYETDSISGTAYVLNKLFFGSNHDYPAPGSLATKLQQLGIKTNVQTDLCGSEFQMNMPAKNWQQSLSILNAALRSPLYPDEEIQNAIAQTEQEYQQIKVDPFYLLSDKMNHSLWTSNYAAQNILGNYQVIKNLNASALLNYHNSAYIPMRTMIVVAGAVNHLDVFTKISSLFSDWKNPTTGSSELNIPVFLPLQSSSQNVITTPLAPAPAMMLSLQIPGLKQNELVATIATVFKQMLNESESSFKNNLVGKDLAQNAEVDFTDNRYGNALNFVLIGNNTNLSLAYTTLQNQLKLFSDLGYYSQTVLHNAKQHLIQDYKFKNEKLEDIVHHVSLAWLKNDIETYTDYESNIDAVTVDDLANFASQFVCNQKFVAGLLISPALKQMLQTDLFFTDTPDNTDFVFSFTRNAADFMGVDNQIKLLQLIQWMKLNPEKKFELNAYQDALEKKETARDRFVSIYKVMLDQGLTESELKTIPVAVYIQHGTTDAEIELNQKIVFKILN